MYKVCAECAGTYLGAQTEIRATHRLSVGALIELDSVLTLPPRKIDPTEDHLYIYWCSSPAIELNAMGERSLVSRCLNARVGNGACRYKADTLFKENNPALVEDVNWCAAIEPSRVPLTVTYKVRLKRASTA